MHKSIWKPLRILVKTVGMRSSQLLLPILRGHPNGEQCKPEYVSCASESRGSLRYSKTCIIREAAEEWFWGGEIAAKMLAAA